MIKNQPEIHIKSYDRIEKEQIPGWEIEEDNICAEQGKFSEGGRKLCRCSKGKLFCVSEG